MTDASGSFTANVTIPAGTALGQHEIEMSGVNRAGDPATITLALTVQATAGTGTLPHTGSSSMPLALAGLTLFAAGTLLAARGAGASIRASDHDATFRCPSLPDFVRVQNMALEVVGAGLGRTGTHSLKAALEQLLDAPCYHMIEVFGRPDDIAVWQSAIDGAMPDWNTFFSGYRAAVDWPACAFWEEIAAANPDAVVLLSSRDADAWWKSASNTIFQISRNEAPPDPVASAQISMARNMFAQRFTPDWTDESAAKPRSTPTMPPSAPQYRPIA